jgi:hypothetical protein
MARAWYAAMAALVVVPLTAEAAERATSCL